MDGSPAEERADYGYPVLLIEREDEIPKLMEALTAPGPLFALIRTSLSAVLPKS